MEQLRAQQLVAASLGAERDPGNQVLDALQSLSARQRAALSLRYLDGYSVAEIAEVLDTSYRAAESILARGRKAFVTAYEDSQ